ncbi:MAG: Tricarboxylate transport protein TctC, partial [uncultured Acetobacteraceae bacterium]
GPHPPPRAARHRRPRPARPPGPGAAALAEPAGAAHLPLGRWRRHGRRGPHCGAVAGTGVGPALQRGEPHRRLRGGGARGHRRGGAGRLLARDHHGRDLHAPLAGADGAHLPQLHAARPDEQRPAGRAGEQHVPAPGRQVAGRRHQGEPAGAAQGVRHRSGRHLALGARRVARRHGAEGRPCALGAFQRRRAGHAGLGGGRARLHHLLGAGGAGDAGRRACPRAGGDGAGAAFRLPEHPDPERGDGCRLPERRLARHRRPARHPGRGQGGGGTGAGQGVQFERVQGVHEQPRLRPHLRRRRGLRAPPGSGGRFARRRDEGGGARQGL